VSLIDEALKRAQEAHDKETGAVRRRPWTPSPMPDRGPARRRRLLAGAALAAMGVLAAVGLLLWRRPAVTKPAAPASERAALPTPLPPTPAPLEEVRVPPPPRGIGTASAPRPAADGKRPAMQAAGPPAPPGPAAASTPPAPPAPADRAGGLASGKTYTGSVALPGGGRLELGGIVYSETNATAVINGRILGEGASIEGFTVARIEESRVTLSGNSVTFYLSVR
jgi:hypothetical protein